MRRSYIFVALLIAAPLAAAQQIYKWTDAHGTVHYSQQAPAQGTKYQQVKLASGVESSATPAPDRTADEPPATAPAPAAAPVADTPENRAKLCSTLKTNLAALQGSSPVVMQQGTKPTVLSDEQRQQQTAQAQAQYQQYCAAK